MMSQCHRILWSVGCFDDRKRTHFFFSVYLCELTLRSAHMLLTITILRNISHWADYEHCRKVLPCWTSCSTDSKCHLYDLISAFCYFNLYNNNKCTLKIDKIGGPLSWLTVSSTLHAFALPVFSRLKKRKSKREQSPWRQSWVRLLATVLYGSVGHLPNHFKNFIFSKKFLNF